MANIKGNINAGYNNSISASTKSSIVGGENNVIGGGATHAFIAGGFGNSATGDYSHAEGYGNLSSGVASHTEGGIISGDGPPLILPNTASEYSSHAEGIGSLASGPASHAEGRETVASGEYTHAEGFSTTAVGTSSHAGGSQTRATGFYSFIHSSANSLVSGHRSVVLGGQGITGSTDDTVYVPNLNIGDNMYLPTPTVPSTSGDTGTTGQLSWDSGFVYVCVATNTWKRTTLSAW
jgi:hypothetical protein